MKLFLDSANFQEIQEAAATGLVDGITTNPSLVARSGKPQEELIRSICDTIGGPVSVEVTSLEADPMIEEGMMFSKWASNVVVKVPLTVQGLKACKALRKEDVQVNVTLCFSAVQAWLAAKADATFVSPFVGRLDDIGGDGRQLLEDISHIFHQSPYCHTEILAASIRNPAQVLMAAQAGADAATLPYSVFQQLYCHPLTEKGLEVFMADSLRIPKV